jgi:hypothetical protein
MRLLYELKVDGKVVQIGRAAAAPAVGDALVVLGQPALRVRARCWKWCHEPDANYDSDLNCVVLDCERVEGGAR